MAPRKPPRIVERPGNKQRDKIQIKKKENQKHRALWWKLQEGWHNEVFAVIDYLDQNQPYRSLLNRYFRATYRNRPPLSASSRRAASQVPGMPLDRLMMNVSKALVQAKRNRVAKNNGRTRFMTNNANYEMREQAQLLEKFCAGLDFSQDTHNQMVRMFDDEEVCGTGAIKVYDEEDDVCTEYKDIDSIIVDEEACVGGKTYEMHERVWMPREMVLEELCGKGMFTEEQIMKAPSDERRAASNGVVSDRICVIESYKESFNSQGTDGIKVISIETGSFAEDWKGPPPYVFLRGEDTQGFYGEGCVERANPKTVELNKMLRTAHLAVALCSIPKYHVHDEAEVVDSEINNEVGGIIRWSGGVPAVVKEVSNSVPPEVWRQIDWLYEKAFREEGVNEMSAAGRKEPGITAAVAIREANDLETDRMAILAQRFEWARVHINELQIEAARRIAKRKDREGYKVKFPLDGDGFLEIDFRDVDLDRNKVIMQPYPSSSLPQTPSARAQWIEERMQSGLIPVEVGRKLMQMPDIEREMNVLTAAARDVDKTLDRMMKLEKAKDGKPVYMPPEPFQNLLLARDRATAKYLELRLVPGVGKVRLELLQRYSRQADQMYKKQQEEEAARQAALQAPPPGASPGPAAPQQPAMPQAPAVAA